MRIYIWDRVGLVAYVVVSTVCEWIEICEYCNSALA